MGRHRSSSARSTRLTRVVWIAGPRPKRTALARAHRHAEDERPPVQLQQRHRDHFGRKLDLTQQHDADVPHGQTADASADRDAQALGDELAHQPRASRTDRHAQRDLARPDRRTAREQARDVRARHAQHGKRQRRQRRPSARRRAGCARTGPRARSAPRAPACRSSRGTPARVPGRWPSARLGRP